MRHTGRLAGLALVIALGGGLNAAAEAQQQGGTEQGMGQYMGMGHGMGQQRGMGHGMGQQRGMGYGMGMQGDGPMNMAERFGEADADGDGKVSRDELVARMTARAVGRIEARADRIIAHHDADDDGMLTLDEMQSGMGGRMFDRLDADGDGAVSREEFAKMREMRGMMRHGKGGAGHHGAHHGDGMGKGRHGMGHGGTGQGGTGQGGVVIHQHFYSGD